MTLEQTDKRRHRRRLSEEERRLWNGVSRSIAPLKRKPAAHLQDSIPAPGERKPPPPPPPKRRRPEPTPARQPTAKSAIKPVTKPALPVIGLDRRQKQRLVRGTETIDARIDLHGKTQGEAHVALLGFLRRAQAQGARYVLVITGKGRTAGPSSGEHGILKRQVPMWLRLPEFRPHVLAVEDAHAAHGGEGALYVRVRKARAQ
jgi:DNA-nicking Smr family endonuclease